MNSDTITADRIEQLGNNGMLDAMLNDFRLFKASNMFMGRIRQWREWINR